METTLTDAVATNLRARRIEPEDFDWIVRQHQKQIYRVLLFLVRNADAADTLTQECFLRAFRKHASFRGDSRLATWLVRIAINLAHDHNKSRRGAFWRRLRQSCQAEAVQVPDTQHSQEQTLMVREKLAAVWSTVEGLSERQRTAFVLRFAEEMSIEAIAQAMDLEAGTVKSHLSRAVEVVRNTCNRPGSQSRAANSGAQE